GGGGGGGGGGVWEEARHAGPPVRQVGEPEPPVGAPLRQLPPHAIQLGREGLQRFGGEAVRTHRSREKPIQVDPDRHGLAPATAPMVRHSARDVTRAPGRVKALAVGPATPTRYGREPWRVPRLPPTSRRSAAPSPAGRQLAPVWCSRTAASTCCIPGTCATWRRLAPSATCWWWGSTTTIPSGGRRVRDVPSC